MKNLFDPSQPLPKKFIIYANDNGCEYICTVDNTRLACVLCADSEYKYTFYIENIMYFFTDEHWLITEIIDPYSIG